MTGVGGLILCKGRAEMSVIRTWSLALISNVWNIISRLRSQDSLQPVNGGWSYIEVRVIPKKFYENPGLHIYSKIWCTRVQKFLHTKLKQLSIVNDPLLNNLKLKQGPTARKKVKKHPSDWVCAECQWSRLNITYCLRLLLNLHVIAFFVSLGCIDYILCHCIFFLEMIHWHASHWQPVT